MRGSLRWSAPAGGPVYAVGGDTAGHVYAAVVVYPPGGGNGTATVDRFAPGGRREWSVPLAPGGFPLGLSVTPDGDAVVAVCSQSTCTMDDGSARISIVRLSPDGGVRWAKEISGDAVRSLDSGARGATLVIVAFWDFERNDIAHTRAMVLDSAGAIGTDVMLDIDRPRAALGGLGGDFAIGGQDRATSRPVYARMASDGTARWRRVVDATRGAVDRIAFAEDGTIAVAGWFEGELRWGGAKLEAAGISGFVAAAREDGAPLWARADASLRNFANMPSALRFGAAGEIVAHTSTTEHAIGNLRALDRVGNPLWRHDFRGDFGTRVGAADVGRSGDVVVGARGVADAPFTGLPYGGEDWFVAVLEP